MKKILYVNTGLIVSAVCVFLVLVVFSLPAVSDPPGEKQLSPFVEQFPIGWIDWDNGYIYGTGRGYLHVNKGSRPKAKRTAKVVATRNIVHLAANIRLDDKKNLEALGKEKVVIKVSALVHFREHKTELIGNIQHPYYEVTLKAPLNGVQGLTSNLLNRLKTIPDWKDLPKKSPDKGIDDSGQPWLVLDARGLPQLAQVRPALFPKVVTPTGKDVYAVNSVNEESLRKRGMVRYVVSDTPQEQLLSSSMAINKLFAAAGLLFPVQNAYAEEAKPEENNKGMKKQKRGRFIIKNVQEAQGLSQANLVISESDALQLKAEDASTNILKQCRVIVIVSSPIGGIEGKNQVYIAKHPDR